MKGQLFTLDRSQELAITKQLDVIKAFSNETSASFVASRLSNISDFLINAILANDLSEGMVQILVAPSVSMTVAKTVLSNRTAVHEGNQSQAYTLAPPISVPNSNSTISIATGGLEGGSVMTSILSFGSLLFDSFFNSDANRNKTHTNRTAPEMGSLPSPKLVSDVLSIKVSVSDGSGSESPSATPVLPSFVASVSVTDSDMIATFVAPVLRHNCTMGVRQTRTLLCPESLVLLNLTCSGLAAATVRHRCPVPQRVCNVLDLKDMKVASDSYCRAVPSAGGGSSSSVTCECGLDKSESGRNASSALSSMLSGSGGAVNLAVMTKFVAGDLGGTMVMSTTGKISAASVAEQSVVVVVAFGLFWLFGLMNMLIRQFDIQVVSKDKPHCYTWMHSSFHYLLGVVGLFTKPLQDKQEVSSSDNRRIGAQPFTTDLLPNITVSLMYQYIVAVLPTVFHPTRTWWQRLKTQFIQHHRSISMFSVFWTLLLPNNNVDNHVSASLVQVYPGTTGVSEVRTKSKKQNHISENSLRRRSVLQVAFILTSVTMSCFVLAWLYDLQYPADDGSCASHNGDMVSCLTRRSLLDNSRSYCKWVSDTGAGLLSPGSIEESRGGLWMKTISLDTLYDGSSMEVADTCVYDDSDASRFVMLMALVITMMVKVPLDFVLIVMFLVLQANTRSQLKHRIVAKELIIKQAGEGENLISQQDWKASSSDDTSAHVEIKGMKGRRVGIVVVNPHLDTHSPSSVRYASVVPQSQSSPTHELLGCSLWSAIVKIILSPLLKGFVNFRQGVYDIYNVYMELDGLPPVISSEIVRARHQVLDTVQATQTFKRVTDVGKGPIASTTANILDINEKCIAHGDVIVKYLHSMWTYATPSEFGVTALQNMLTDILRYRHATSISKNPAQNKNSPDVSNDSHINAAPEYRRKMTPPSNQFAAVLAKEFPKTFYVSDGLQVVFAVLVVLLNLGALYFVLLKGTSRGYVWQQALLQVCFLDWFIQLAVHQTFEVWFVHFMLPNLIYEEVQSVLREWKTHVLPLWLQYYLQSRNRKSFPNMHESSLATKLFYTHKAVEQLPSDKALFRQCWEVRQSIIRFSIIIMIHMLLQRTRVSL